MRELFFTSLIGTIMACMFLILRAIIKASDIPARKMLWLWGMVGLRFIPYHLFVYWIKNPAASDIYIDSIFGEKARGSNLLKAVIQEDGGLFRIIEWFVNKLLLDKRVLLGYLLGVAFAIMSFFITRLLLKHRLNLNISRRKKIEIVKLGRDVDSRYEILAPFLWGYDNQIIVIPSWVPEEYEAAVIDHESFHHDHHDNYILLAVHLLCIMHWFNPIVWLVLRPFFISDLERACHEGVVNGRTEKGRIYYLDGMRGVEEEKKKTIEKLRKQGIKGKIFHTLSFVKTTTRGSDLLTHLSSYSSIMTKKMRYIMVGGILICFLNLFNPKGYVLNYNFFDFTVIKTYINIEYEDEGAYIKFYDKNGDIIKKEKLDFDDERGQIFPISYDDYYHRD